MYSQCNKCILDLSKQGFLLLKYNTLNIFFNGIKFVILIYYYIFM